MITFLVVFYLVAGLFAAITYVSYVFLAVCVFAGPRAGFSEIFKWKIFLSALALFLLWPFGPQLLVLINT